MGVAQLQCRLVPLPGLALKVGVARWAWHNYSAMFTVHGPVCYLQTSDLDNPRIVLRKPQIRRLRRQSRDCPSVNQSALSSQSSVLRIHMQ